MSRHVFAVCEGKTDFTVLKAVLGTIDMATVATLIQPETSLALGHAGPHGGGWHGVRSWCRTDADLPLGEDAILILHVDADIAADVDAKHPCPPARDTVDALRAMFAEDWLLGRHIAGRVVFFVPSQSTETWLLAALHPTTFDADTDPECMPAPQRRLIGKPEKLVRSKDAGEQKIPAAYENVVETLRARWSTVTALLPEARRFDEELRAVLAPT